MVIKTECDMHHNQSTEIADRKKSQPLIWPGRYIPLHICFQDKKITRPQVRELDSITGHKLLHFKFTLVLEETIYVS